MKTKYYSVILAVIFLALCFSPVLAGVKYTGPAGTSEIEKDDVQSARGFPDQYKQYCVLLELTKKGAKRFFTMTENNEGNYVSIHFDDKLLTPKLFVAEPMYTREIAIQVNDEKLMNEIIKFYEKYKDAGIALGKLLRL